MAKRTVGRKRRNFFVNKSFQFRFGIIIFVAMLVAGVIAFWTSYVTTYEEISRQMSSSTFFRQIDHIYTTQSDARSREAQI
ncbi:MAG: hypothetical protein NC924_03355, partial [Candidatus Omnitrophica bacterium]|nr:hypothetical protein [Candidatus Omnitrophota bacterium]